MPYAKRTSKKPATDAAPVVSSGRKTPVSQSDVPRHSVHEALRVAQTITDEYAGAPTKPLHVAAALDMTVNSSHFRMLVGASAAYGFTTGAWKSDSISLTPLGKTATSANADQERQAAIKEAFLRPRVVSAFLTRYANNRFPKDVTAKTVLVELGVPVDSTEHTLKLIIKGATDLGLLRELKGSQYVDLDGVPVGTETQVDEEADEAVADKPGASVKTPAEVIQIAPSQPLQPNTSNNRVFITHGKNLDIVNQLKELLSFGNFVPVVSAEHETISKPVPDKVMDDMRSCSAAIIHVGKEVKVLDQEGKEHVFINQNVLIEIGAAMALYGRKFILLVERGSKLPSNLQGLYEVRYEGDKLDYEATMKLLKAFSDFRH
jgi:predicted nucleotide-binding protein